jgi:hypothetical protein
VQPKRSSSAFEYFLYAAILAETGLAALIYKVIFNSDLLGLRVYFAIFYFAFLAWAIAQLNKLHRARAAQPELTAPESVPAPREDSGPVLGLSVVQLVIILVVFATAIATFSWALRLIG